MEYVNGVGFAFDWGSVEGRILTILIRHDGLTVSVMAEHDERGAVLYLTGAHVAAEGNATLTRAWMRRVAETAMEVMGYDAIIVEGAARTTGARPGHSPQPFRFTRRGDSGR